MSFATVVHEEASRVSKVSFVGSLFIAVSILLILPSCGGKKVMQVPAGQTSRVEQRDESSSSSSTSKSTADNPGAVTFEDVLFDYDQSTLRADAQSILARHARTLLDRPDMRIRIEGHCDERGTVEYNLSLGDRRAQVVHDYLVAYGVPRDRLSTISFGKERPLDPSHSEDAWSRNRRAAFAIVSPM